MSSSDTMRTLFKNVMHYTFYPISDAIRTFKRVKLENSQRITKPATTPSATVGRQAAIRAIFGAALAESFVPGSGFYGAAAGQWLPVDFYLYKMVQGIEAAVNRLSPKTPNS